MDNYTMNNSYIYRYDDCSLFRVGNAVTIGDSLVWLHMVTVESLVYSAVYGVVKSQFVACESFLANTKPAHKILLNYQIHADFFIWFYKIMFF